MMTYMLIFGSGLEALTAVLTIEYSHKRAYENFYNRRKRQELKYSLLGSISDFWILHLFNHFLQLSDQEPTSRGRIKFLIE